MTLKLFILAVLFVISGGAAYSEYFKGHKFLSLLAMVVAIIATFYLFKDIEEDIIRRSTSSSSEVEPFPVVIPSPKVEPVVIPSPKVEPSPPVVPETPTEKPEIPPIKMAKGEFTAYFQPKQDMFETTAAFQARRQQLLQQFNHHVEQRHLDYQTGVLRLNHYNADAQTFAVNLDWQADWVKRFFGELENKGEIKIGVKEAKQIYQAGTEKPLFLMASLMDNQVNVQGVMVEKGQTYSIETKFLLGQVFRDRLQDGSSGPKMVVIPAGRFRMGDIQGGGSDDEKPVHRVSIKQFAMGKYEVTFAEYDKFAQAKGQEKPNDQGWGRGNRPVINVSWDDAVAYAEWLSQQTGKEYRLPTEAEWEYAARAGTDTKYWWGNDIGSNKANCSGDYCGDRFEYTSPIGSFTANPFGLYDTAGNVWEWTCSEYENKYSGKEKQCISKNRARQPVVRGGSWGDRPGGVRTAYRGRFSHGARSYDVGFRLARITL